LPTCKLKTDNRDSSCQTSSKFRWKTN